MTTKGRLRGAGYVRMSDDAEGLELGVTRQKEDVIALAAAEGIDLPEDRILIENDTGASTRSKKPRPKYKTLVSWATNREVDVVLFYSNSRLTRRPAELEEWITLHEKTGIQLRSKVSGTDDLGTADGRMVARIKASVDAAEAERIGERVSRAFEQRRAQGKPHHGPHRPFGFRSNAGEVELVPEEVEAIRHGAALLLNGASLGEVAREWAARGLAPSGGAPTWTRQSVRSLYTSPRLAGLVSHRGEIVGAGNFPAILDRALWEAVNGAIEHAASRPAGYGARVHVLAGFVFCGTCGATMVVQRDTYTCVKARHGCGSIRRNKAWLDAYIDGEVRGMLSHATSVRVEAGQSGVTQEITEVEERIASTRARFEAGQLDDEDFFPLLSGMRARLKELRKQEGEEARSQAREAVLLDPLQVWEGGTLVARRALLRTLIQGIYVLPVGRIGRRPLTIESVRVVPS